MKNEHKNSYKVAALNLKNNYFQGIVTQKSYDYDMKFDCEDISLSCNAWSQVRNTGKCHV